MKTSFFVVVGMIFLSTLSCTNQVSTFRSGNITSTLPANAEAKKSSKIEVKGWWWRQEELHGGFNTENLPPKTDYVALEEWNASDGLSLPHPDKIDLVGLLDSADLPKEKVRIIGSVEFKIASYRQVVNANSEKEVNEILDVKPWADVQTLGETDINFSRSSDSQTVKFESFDLGHILNKYLKSTTKDLWPWKMRAVIRVYDSNNKEVFALDKVIDIVPGD